MRLYGSTVCAIIRTGDKAKVGAEAMPRCCCCCWFWRGDAGPQSDVQSAAGRSTHQHGRLIVGAVDAYVAAYTVRRRDARTQRVNLVTTARTHTQAYTHGSFIPRLHDRANVEQMYSKYTC